MALQQLTGADCGQYNPLVQLTTHLTRDHTFTENYGQQSVFPNSSDQLVQQFLEETRPAPQTFRMDDLMREMHEIESQRAVLPPVPASTVKDHLSSNIWAIEYTGREEGPFERQDLKAHEEIWADISIEKGNNQLELPSCSVPHEWLQECREQSAIDEEQQTSANALVNAVDDDPQFAYSKFLKFMKHVSNGNTSHDGEEQEQIWSDEYLLNSSKLDYNKNDNLLSQAWDHEEQEQQQQVPHVIDDDDDGSQNKFWDKLQDEWRKLAQEQESSLEEHPWISDFNDYYDTYKDYEFNEENPMIDSPNSLQKGKELLEKGDLPGAVLCFEAAVKQEPENVEAWQLLGTTQAENEQDPNAICALKHCLQLQPDNLQVLMALAVSYTNESYHHQACQSLVNWLRRHPIYSDVVPPDFQLSGQVTSLLDHNEHKTVQDLFIKVAQRRPVNPDYEVQCGLGVLFNLSGEYDKAADCFRVALNIRPEDARLWNRLGATLANGNRPEEAIEAYHRALNLSPGFIRARYNVGITCINLGAYREAAEHFLIALNQQSRGRGIDGGKSQMSETIWATLRMCITLMNNTSELRMAIDDRNLNVLNEAFNINDS